MTFLEFADKHEIITTILIIALLIVVNAAICDICNTRMKIARIKKGEDVEEKS